MTLSVCMSRIPQSHVKELPLSPQCVMLLWWCGEDAKNKTTSTSRPLCLLRRWGVSIQAAFGCVFRGF